MKFVVIAILTAWAYTLCRAAFLHWRASRRINNPYQPARRFTQAERLEIAERE